MGCCCLKPPQNKVSAPTTNLTLQIHQTRIKVSYPTKTSSGLDNEQSQAGGLRHQTESGLFTARDLLQDTPKHAAPEGAHTGAQDKQMPKRILAYTASNQKPSLVPVSKGTSKPAHELSGPQPLKVDIGVNYTKNIRILSGMPAQSGRKSASAFALPPLPVDLGVPKAMLTGKDRLRHQQTDPSCDFKDPRYNNAASNSKINKFWSNSKQRDFGADDHAKKGGAQPHSPMLQPIVSERESQLDASGYSASVSAFRELHKHISNSNPALAQPSNREVLSSQLINGVLVTVKDIQLDDNFHKQSITCSDEFQSNSMSLGYQQHFKHPAGEETFVRREPKHQENSQDPNKQSYQVMQTIKTRSIWDDMKKRNKSANDALLKMNPTSGKSPGLFKDNSVKKPTKLVQHREVTPKKKNTVPDTKHMDQTKDKDHKQDFHPHQEAAIQEEPDTPKKLSVRYSSKKVWDNNKSAIDTISEHFSSEEVDDSISLRGGHRNDRFDSKIQGKDLRLSSVGLEQLKKRNLTNVNF